METKALAVRQPVTPEIWRMIEAVSPTVWRAGLFGVGNTEAAAAIMLKGYEIGLGLTASFEFIHVIGGRPALSPRGALAIIQQSNELESIKIDDLADATGPTRCRVTMKRTNGFEYTTEFSMDDAKRAGLVKDSSGWAKYPANMLRWRAIGYCADVVFPDVIGGMKRVDEFTDVTPDGNTLDAEWNTVEIISDNNSGSISPTPAEITAELIAQYGGENALAMFGTGEKDFRPDSLEHLDMVSQLLGEVCGVCGEACGKHQGNKMCEANDD